MHEGVRLCVHLLDIEPATVVRVQHGDNATVVGGDDHGWLPIAVYVADFRVTHSASAAAKVGFPDRRLLALCVPQLHGCGGAAKGQQAADVSASVGQRLVQDIAIRVFKRSIAPAVGLGRHHAEAGG